MKLQNWPLTGPLRILGILLSLSEISMVALHREAWQGSWQNRVGEHERMECHMGAWQTTNESRKIMKLVLSTTVADLYSFMKCFGSCQFLRGL